MIPDNQTNMVFISDQLEARYPLLVRGLRRILADYNIPLQTIVGTKDIWCRDYMPVRIDADSFVWFRYAPDYLQGYESLITLPEDIGPLPQVENCKMSGIVLDGGNIVGWDNRCIVTDKIYRENPDIDQAELVGKLEALFRVDALVVIPKEPHDPVGRADGVVRFIDRGTVAVNDYSRADPSYRGQLISALRRANLNWVEVPYSSREGRLGELPPAFGNYVNFLRVHGLVVLPSYGIPEDERALRVIRDQFVDSDVVPLDCAELSWKGGVLNCVTWGVLGR